MDPTQIIEALSGLDPDELQAIAAALRDLLAARDSPTVVISVPDVVAERMVRGVTYRLEHVRCGKPQCRCAGGACHGPYWYAYWFTNGKTRKRYIGKHFRTVERE
ncbi:MAG TPA: hypothetical protein PKK15_00210 [Kouleothrix sp.]|nr:hypothetical protein [Kouleothrix sp.]